MGFQNWEYDVDGQSIFGLPILQLSHSRSVSEEAGERTYHYGAVVRGDMNRVRWMIERLNPDIMCQPLGTNWSCSPTVTSNNGFGQRSLFIGNALTTAGAAEFGAGATVFYCTWGEPLTR